MPPHFWLSSADVFIVNNLDFWKTLKFKDCLDLKLYHKAVEMGLCETKTEKLMFKCLLNVFNRAVRDGLVSI